MSDERICPAWGYCTHGFWCQGYWCCLDERCGYRYEPVPAGTADLSRTYDTAGHNGYDLAAGPGANGQNSLGDETFGYGGTTAYDEWRGDHPPSSQQGQDAYPYVVQQHDNQQNVSQQNNHRYNNQDDGQPSGYQNGYAQNDQQDNVGRSDYQDGRYQWNVQPPGPASDVSVNMGSWSSAGQTNSPTSTETPDNEDASMTGNADEDNVMPYVEEQPAVGIDERDDQYFANQEISQFATYFPEHLNHDTRDQYRSSYPPVLCLSDGSESGVTQSNNTQSNVE
ncbi:hypothetical protein NW759_004649 [Fusarium solani]|nr:hypothetical protein NW759_004649 [Fusarium solani]